LELFNCQTTGQKRRIFFAFSCLSTDFAFWLLRSEDQFPLLYRRDVLQQVFLFYSCYNIPSLTVAKESRAHKRRNYAIYELLFSF